MHSLISFKSYTVSYITNLDNSVHPFPLLFLLLFLRTLLTFLHPECCATPFIVLFQQRNAQSHTSHPLTQFRFSPFCLSATQRWTFSLFIHSSSHCCSTSFRNDIISLFSDSIRISKSADRSVSRDASLAVNRCLHPFYQENDLHITRWIVNLFDYILLVILNI